MTLHADGNLLYPRLPRDIAWQLEASMRNLSLEDLVDRSALYHPEAAPNPVGGAVVGPDVLSVVRHEVRALAKSFGFPAGLSKTGKAAFDRQCGTLLFQRMGILTADAGSDAVWAFVTLVLLPEIAPWRFPSRNSRRLFGGVRNMFQRLWWRSWSLGPDLTLHPDGVEPFGEDDYVQLMERPRVSGNARVARTLQAVIWATKTTESGPTRSELVRSITIRVLARRSYISLDALSDAQLLGLFEQLRDDVVESYRRSNESS